MAHSLHVRAASQSRAPICTIKRTSSQMAHDLGQRSPEAKRPNMGMNQPMAKRTPVTTTSHGVETRNRRRTVGSLIDEDPPAPILLEEAPVFSATDGWHACTSDAAT